MQASHRVFVLAGLSLLLAGCDGSGAQADATSIHEADRIFVQANQCESGIRQALGEQGLGLAVTETDADSTLQVMLSVDGRNLDELPEFGGFGSKANYKADLVGEDGRLLYSTAGEEGSATYDEMCEDIGDEIAERIQHSKKA